MPIARDRGKSAAALARRALKTGVDLIGRSGRSLPRFVLMGCGPHPVGRLAETAGLVDAETPILGLSWHLAEKAVWIAADSAVLSDPDGSWREFLKCLAVSPLPASLGGLVLVVDAAQILEQGDNHLRRQAVQLRDRFDKVLRLTGVRPPVHLLVDGIDRFYGMRSLAASAGMKRLNAPLGAFRNGSLISASELAAEAVDTARGALAKLSRRIAARQVPVQPAVLQAADEVARLRTPLERLCSETFTPNPHQTLPVLDGVFFCSCEPGGDVFPSRLSKLASFQSHAEPPAGRRSLFLDNLLRTVIPSTADPARVEPLGGGRLSRFLSRHAAAAAMSAGMLGLGIVVGLSFLEEKNALGGIADAVGQVRSQDDLQALASGLRFLEERNKRRWLPRFGMDESLRAEKELRTRYSAAYRALVLQPELDSLEREVSSVIDASDPVRLGDALQKLAELRLHHGVRKRDARLRTRADGSGDSSAAILPDWTSDPEAQLRLEECLSRCERRLLFEALAGDVSEWLPAWTDARADSPPADTASVWEPLSLSLERDDARIIRPAWTFPGYRKAQALLESLRPDDPEGLWPAHRAAVLVAYRRKALAAWRDAAGALWRGGRESVDDSRLESLMARLAAGDDPASRFRSLLIENIVPMFSDGDDDPDVDWLRRVAAVRERKSASSGGELVQAWKLAGELEDAHRELAVLSESPAAMVELLAGYYQDRSALSGNILNRAGALAANLDRMLDRSGSAVWKPVSVSAVHDYSRFLAARLAARELESRWREEAEPRIRNGGAAAEVVREFLSTKAGGLWRREGDEIVNASRDRLTFMFSREFLDYCGEALSGGTTGAEEGLLALSIRSFGVNADAREKPQAVELSWTHAAGVERLAYRNYPAAAEFPWRRGSGNLMTITIEFPSGIVKRKFSETETADMLERLANGSCVLSCDAFSEHAGQLSRLGVTRFVIRGAAANPPPPSPGPIRLATPGRIVRDAARERAGLAGR